VKQCGCQANATCYLDTETGMGACTPPLNGKRAIGEHCDSAGDCVPGTTCLVGTFNVCTRWCYIDADCDADASCFNPANEMGMCLDKCSRTDSSQGCAEGLICAQLSYPQGDYCWKPYANCDPVRRDGKCQEDSGFCAKGSDPEDCCKPPVEGGICDPFAQCGCEEMPGTQCVPLRDRTFTCAPAGPNGPSESCESSLDCGQGTMCVDGVCRKPCPLDVGCGDDSYCAPTNDVSNADAGTLSFGACIARCDFEQNNCTGVTQCMRIGPNLVWCDKPASECPPTLIGDGKCDDTSANGTRQCELGTDPDCDNP
jgi:hypothetical protein